MAGAKKAVLVGCNYPGTTHGLNGCVNDVLRMKACLIDKYGFAEEDIAVLIDTDDSYEEPNGRNIRAALTKLVASAEPGDCLLFHYSGHGCRQRAKPWDDDDTGFDEGLVPCDNNLIYDDEMRDFVDNVPEGCYITIIADSCHSGGLIERTKEQIGESTKGDNSDEEESESDRDEEEPNGGGEDTEGEEGYGCSVPPRTMKKRSLPVRSLINNLRQKIGADRIDAGQLKATLFRIFGDDSSPKVKNFMSFMGSKLQGGSGSDGLGGGGGGFRGTVANPEENVDGGFDKRDAYARSDASEPEEGPENRGILISGCQTNQRSYEDSSPSNPDEVHGALTQAILTIVSEQGSITNRDLVLRTRDVLAKWGYNQRPGLYCSDQYLDRPFIC